MCFSPFHLVMRTRSAPCSPCATERMRTRSWQLRLPCQWQTRIPRAAHPALPLDSPLRLRVAAEVSSDSVKSRAVAAFEYRTSLRSAGTMHLAWQSRAGSQRGGAAARAVLQFSVSTALVRKASVRHGLNLNRPRRPRAAASVTGSLGS